jgi:8-oxo-dGTP pyrophosphatase MutT (NUDIX family)
LVWFAGSIAYAAGRSVIGMHSHGLLLGGTDLRDNRNVIELIRERLQGYQPQPAEGAFRARAAVLLPVYTQRDGLHMVFTKRTDKVDSHKGEICFPGGAMDRGDRDLAVTALRESHEEIGLERDHVRLMGRLDDIITISSFHVTAYVGEIDPGRLPYIWRRQEREVAEVLEIPLAHLLDAANFVELPRSRDGELVLQPGVRFGEHVIWGATYRMLRNFLEVAVAPTTLPPPLATVTQPYEAPAAAV